MKVHRRDLLRASVVSVASIAGRARAAEDGAKAVFQARPACSAESWARAGRPLEQALAEIAAAGYEGVECSADALLGFRDDPDKLGRLLEANRLQLAAAVLSGDLLDARERLLNISRAVQAARLLEHVGARVLILRHEGAAGPRSPREFQRFSAHLAEVGAPVFEETGLRCAYEFAEREAADVRKIVATSDSHYVKFSFDAAALQRVGVRVGPMVRAYRERLVHVRVRGSEAGFEALTSLAEIGYSDWVTVVPADINPAMVRTELVRFQEETARIRVEPAKEEEYPSPAGRGNKVTALPPRDPNYSPLFFADAQFRDLSRLVDAILPATDTPGALAARADEHADLMIWLDEARHDGSRRQVEAFRRFCNERYGRRFSELSVSETEELLSLLSGEGLQGDARTAAAFFERIRGLSSQAYYASPQGLIEELGYRGNDYVMHFEGCADGKVEA